MNLILNLGYTVLTRFYRYMTTNRILPADNIKLIEQSIEDEEFQIILSPLSSIHNEFPLDEPLVNRRIDSDVIRYDLRSMMPIIYNKCIDDAVKQYTFPEMIIKRLPDYGFMSIYMIQGLSQDKIDTLCDSIYLRRCEDRVLIEYKGKQYQWYYTTLLIDEDNFIFGPDHDILVHFRCKPIYIS